MNPMIGTGPTPGITERQYRRRQQIVQMLYANAANETSRKMAARLARSWELDYLLPKQEQDRNKKIGAIGLKKG